MPITIAPYKIAILPLYQSKNNITNIIQNNENNPNNSNINSMDIAHELYDYLNSYSYLNNEIFIDDRIQLSLGSRIKEAQLIGIPLIVILGKSLSSGLLEV